MFKILITLALLLLISSCDDEQPYWPKSCLHKNQQGLVVVMISDSYEVSVDGGKYKTGLIKEHVKELERTCERVKVIISFPKGAMKSNGELLMELLGEAPKSPNGKSSVALAERK